MNGLTKDEKALKKALKQYRKAVKKYELDDMDDGWGQSNQRYMYDGFVSGFFAGRDYEREKRI